MRRLITFIGIGCAAALCGYAAYVAYAFGRYGHPHAPSAQDQDGLLDRFIPVYDVVERHHVTVDAPADRVLEAAGRQELLRLPVVRTIFRAREVLLGATPDRADRPRGLLAETASLGWLVLAEIPGREIVVGAVTRPWEANVTFRGIPPESFAAFTEPGYVKIVWTLRADPVGPDRAIFRTETRAVATDAFARRQFRRYWSFLSPGIIGIRWLAAAHLKREVRLSSAFVPNRESAIRHP